MAKANFKIIKTKTNHYHDMF